MSRKFSIIEKIDLKKIDNEIQRYKLANKLYNRWDDPYIFMSEETARAIESKNDVVVENETIENKIKNIKGGVYATYTGYKVFIDNDLKFGVVEIR